MYFYCFGGWKTNQCRKKNIVFVAFLWSVSLWASLNFSAYGFKTKWSFQNTYFCKIGKSCHDQNFFSMSAGWISDHMVGIPPTSIETSQDGWNSNHLQLLNWFFFLHNWFGLSTKGSHKKRIFYGQPDRKGWGGQPSALTVSKCENFDPFISTEGLP